MNDYAYTISAHAARRMAQRNIEPDDIAEVIRLGRVTHRSRAEFYFLGRRDLPQGCERDFEHLVGITVVVVSDQVATAYRNRRAISKIRRKPKRMRRRASAESASRMI